MIYLYRLNDGQFLRGLTSRPDYDPASEGVQEYLDHLRPDLRLHRFDATTSDKKRLATAQELAAYDAARLDASAQVMVTDDKRLLVLAEYVRLQLNVIRRALPIPLDALTRAQVLEDLKTIFKALP